MEKITETPCLSIARPPGSQSRVDSSTITYFDQFKRTLYRINEKKEGNDIIIPTHEYISFSIRFTRYSTAVESIVNHVKITKTKMDKGAVNGAPVHEMKLEKYEVFVVI